MKFFPLKETDKIPWIDGAVILVGRPTDNEKETVRDACHNENITDPYEIGDRFLEIFIKGWEAIEAGDSSEPLAFNIENRKALWTVLKTDHEMFNKIMVFAQGPLGNLKAGSTSITNMDGANGNASPASENVPKKE
jgi:hypothetical protein